MQSQIIRVFPREYGWALEVGDLNAKVQIFPTMEAAIAAGWGLARQENAELHIHRHDGNLRWRTSGCDQH
ncbi:DUF2188 domain-containing protein [Cupriavidus sp. WKF15]|uniref:DUF2188 domain-containing protein n=1 Tax=Cupriavidus sp. WKF15 TaxID=3032282 RepID=UPI0023E257BE|nr:DUF2188 domain-containing protein [Cupriavidus sp. WKF15]WER49281.1 DUF2188 domain-containing protein [Cupriavidus sp. WKF15]